MHSTRSCEPAMNSGKSSTKYLTASLDTLKADKRYYVGDITRHAYYYWGAVIHTLLYIADRLRFLSPNNGEESSPQRHTAGCAPGQSFGSEVDDCYCC